MADDRPVREIRKGTETYPRPFREGYLNPRLNKNLCDRWLTIDTDSFDTHIGFVDHTDWYETCDDIPDECSGRSLRPLEGDRTDGKRKGTKGIRR